MPLADKDMLNWNDVCLVTHSAKQRLLAYQDKWTNEGKDPEACLSNIAQNLSFCTGITSLMPALLRGSEINSFGKKRLLTPAEHFVVNGMPIWLDNDACMISTDVFTALKPSTARQLSGNMMNVQVVHCVIAAAVMMNQPNRERDAGRTASWSL